MVKLYEVLIVNILETILQNRITVNKKQMTRFNEINKQIKKNKEKVFDGEIQEFFTHLFIEKKYNLFSSIDISSGFLICTLFFRLQNRTNLLQIDAEAWTIQFQSFTNVIQNEDQLFKLVVVLFEELLMFLNQQPLFSLYQRDTVLRKNYELIYHLKIRQKQSKKRFQSTLFDYGQKYVIQRFCNSFSLKILAYISPKYQTIKQNYKQKPLLPNKIEEQEQQEQTTNKVQQKKQQVLASGSMRKSSVFQFYDKDLDFMFLSSQDENFGNNKSHQVDLSTYLSKDDGEDDDDDQFELLMMDKDEEIAIDCKNLFDNLSKAEKSSLYF